MCRYISLLFFILFITSAEAQDFNSYKEQQLKAFQSYKQKSQEDWDAYRRKANEEFAKYLEQAWVRKTGQKPIEKPKDIPDIPPVVLPEIDIDIPEDAPIDVDINLPILEDKPINIPPIFLCLSCFAKISIKKGGLPHHKLFYFNFKTRALSCSNTATQNILTFCGCRFNFFQLFNQCVCIFDQFICCERHFANASMDNTFLFSTVFNLSSFCIRSLSAAAKSSSLQGASVWEIRS